MPETWLAFDLGTKKTGVAVGNTLLKSAQPLTIIRSSVRSEVLAKAHNLLTEWQAVGFVLGHVKYPDGSDHPSGLRSAKFARQLAQTSKRRFVLVDERLSSQEAKALAGAADDDAHAAAIILMQFFSDN